jgi:hypothetical protein
MIAKEIEYFLGFAFYKSYDHFHSSEFFPSERLFCTCIYDITFDIFEIKKVERTRLHGNFYDVDNGVDFYSYHEKTY